MPRYWWVNHNQTARQEIRGNYLWSPKTEIHGARSQFYDNMREADPGDLVLSYSEQAVRFVGRVADFAYTAAKPEEFGAIGSNWSQVGWLLPVFWTDVSPPVRPKAISREIGPLLPAKYSPLQMNGDGNQKAYLAEIDEDLFYAVTSHTTFDSTVLRRGGANSLVFEVAKELMDDTVEQAVAADMALTDTERDSVIKARRGQGAFRANVEAIERECRLTGISNPLLLRASHIKPWRLCATAAERLDGMNGLLLTPDADHLFDRGFITFEEDGAVRPSARVNKSDLRRLGFDQLAIERFGFEEAPMNWNVGAFLPAQQDYLGFHRQQVFVS
jgi:putative restriction endonuclease